MRCCSCCSCRTRSNRWLGYTGATTRAHTEQPIDCRACDSRWYLPGTPRRRDRGSGDEMGRVWRPETGRKVQRQRLETRLGHNSHERATSVVWVKINHPKRCSCGSRLTTLGYTQNAEFHSSQHIHRMPNNDIYFIK